MGFRMTINERLRRMPTRQPEPEPKARKVPKKDPKMPVAPPPNTTGDRG